MQIGSSMPLFTPPPTATPARPLSPDASPDLARADQPPPSPAQENQADTSASGREEADRDIERSPGEAERSPQQARQEKLEIEELVQRDREVRTHEQAHAAVGGQYAGAPTYSFKRGPDGQSYAVSGEVSIDTAPVPNDPEATLRKMEVVLRAALAPVEPSGQDLSVASQAQTQAAQAHVELAELRRDEAEATRQAQQESAAGGEEEASPDEQSVSPATPSATPELELYRNLSGAQEPGGRLDLIA